MHRLLKELPAAQAAGIKSAPFLGDTGGGSLAQPLSMGMLVRAAAPEGTLPSLQLALWRLQRAGTHGAAERVRAGLPWMHA